MGGKKKAPLALASGFLCVSRVTECVLASEGEFNEEVLIENSLFASFADVKCVDRPSLMHVSECAWVFLTTVCRHKPQSLTIFCLLFLFPFFRTFPSFYIYFLHTLYLHSLFICSVLVVSLFIHLLVFTLFSPLPPYVICYPSFLLLSLCPFIFASLHPFDCHLSPCFLSTTPLLPTSLISFYSLLLFCPSTLLPSTLFSSPHLPAGLLVSHRCEVRRHAEGQGTATSAAAAGTADAAAQQCDHLGEPDGPGWPHPTVSGCKMSCCTAHLPNKVPLPQP